MPTLLASFMPGDKLILRPFRGAKPAEYGLITKTDAPLSWSCEAFMSLMREESARANGTGPA